MPKLKAQQIWGGKLYLSALMIQKDKEWDEKKCKCFHTKKINCRSREKIIWLARKGKILDDNVKNRE